MSATINKDATNSVSHQQGEVGSHVPRKAPETTHGHKPGVMTGKDQIPESHVQTMPAGTAPKENTYVPRSTQSEVPGQAANPTSVDDETEGQGATSASDTLMGATSADVHTGLGHPGSGQTSNELRHDGGKHREGHATGLQGVGASGAGHFDQQGSTGKRVPKSAFEC